MANRLNLTGNRYGKIVAVRSLDIETRRGWWLCQCDCGKQTTVSVHSLRSGNTSSCGCLNKRRGGLSSTPTGQSWYDMIRRCYDPKRKDFSYYGGRGIGVCLFLRESPKNVITLIGEKPNGFTMDRILTDGNYTCGQCEECHQKNWLLNIRWSDRKTQARNRRYVHRITINGITKTPPEWAEEAGIRYRAIKSRMARGLTGVDLISPTLKPTVFQGNGCRGTVGEISKETNISRWTIRGWINRGLLVEAK